MTDKYQELREALAEATPGPWRTGRLMPSESITRHQVVAPDVDGIPYVILEGNQNFIDDAQKNAAYVAAANPAAIAELLAERDALRESLRTTAAALSAAPINDQDRILSPDGTIETVGQILDRANILLGEDSRWPTT